MSDDPTKSPAAYERAARASKERAIARVVEQSQGGISRGEAEARWKSSMERQYRKKFNK